ncbi:MAG: biopolymer transporter ExbD [Candidatus Eisenbacteria bacterium]|nr:biopolymer transporter ExbD [Candidatus Eisenbacteria bacterium]
MAKGNRANIFIDMTPMVDVCMLLLTFFMLTTQFRPPAEAEVILPASHAAFKLPESNVMTVWVTRDENIFLGVDSQQLRVKIFGEENRLRTSVLVQDKQTLADLMVRARIANPKLRTVVRGDKDTPYGVVEDVMNVLQQVKITRFSLVTELETQ